LVLLEVLLGIQQLLARTHHSQNQSIHTHNTHTTHTHTQEDKGLVVGSNAALRT
jgi:hypothetical protein